MRFGRVAFARMGVLGFAAAASACLVPVGGAAQAEPGLAVPGLTPVLLVPGWGDTAADLFPLRERMRRAGWPGAHLSVLTFANSVGSNEEHAAEIDQAIARLLEHTGREQVDIVAHSMGGLAVRLLLAEEGVRSVRRVVFLGTPHRGTVTALIARGDGGDEMVPGSEFLEGLNRGLPSHALPEMLALRSPLDLIVIPNASAILPGARNEEICCPTHQGLLDDEGVFRRIRQFLEADRETSPGRGAAER